jgi:hypothetical protein
VYDADVRLRGLNRAGSKTKDSTKDSNAAAPRIQAAAFF